MNLCVAFLLSYEVLLSTSTVLICLPNVFTSLPAQAILYDRSPRMEPLCKPNLRVLSHLPTSPLRQCGDKKQVLRTTVITATIHFTLRVRV